MQFTEDGTKRVVEDFQSLTEEQIKAQYGFEDTRKTWRLSKAIEDIRAHKDIGRPARFLYRPFDTRWVYYTGTTGGIMYRSAYKAMRHMLASGQHRNLGLVSGRQTRYGCIATVTRDIIGHKAGDRYDISSLFPLYQYPQDGPQGQLQPTEGIPNLSPDYVAAMKNATGLRYLSNGESDLAETFGPEDVFGYIYAVLHSPEYRRRYADFLKHDFPHIPLPAAGELFAELAVIGKRLIDLHLLEDNVEAGQQQPRFHGQDHWRIEQVTHEPATSSTPGRVRINDREYFEGVSSETWATTIGGYQPAKRWLEDRTGHTLDWDDVRHYKKLCLALAETPSVTQEIDNEAGAKPQYPRSQPRANKAVKPLFEHFATLSFHIVTPPPV